MKKQFFLVLGALLWTATLAAAQPPVTQPPVAQPAVTVPEPVVEAVSFDAPAPAADALERGWVSVDYLLWWVRKGPLNSPLLTIGSPADAIGGALGQPGTQVIFGNRELNYNAFSGARVAAGLSLIEFVSVEGAFFWLGERSVQAGAASDATGAPLIARPVFNNQTGLSDVYATSNPGLFAGATTIRSHATLQGYDVNLAVDMLRFERSNFDMLVGFRAFDLNEDLVIQDLLTPLAAGVPTFTGGPVNPPSTITDSNRFHTYNHFYGGQIGGRWQALLGPFSLGLTGKVALGNTRQTVIIDGSSTLTTPGVPSVTVPGGVLAQVTNIGQRSRDVFSAIPEGGVNFGWQITPSLTATLGYTFLWWPNVLRPGNQIDRTVNPALPPTGQLFANGLGQARPGFAFQSSDFWAQGVTFGLTFRF